MRALESIHPGWGITAVRVMVGIILVVAGWQKLAGGMEGLAGSFGQMGIPVPGVVAPLIMALELGGGILLLLGIGARWLGLLYIVEFIVAGLFVAMPARGFNGARTELLLLAAGALFFLAGAGKASLDELLARRRGEPAPA